MYIGIGSAIFSQDVQLAVQKGHSDVIDLLEFSPSGELLASRTVNNEIIIWNVALNKTLGSFNISSKDPVSSMKFVDGDKKLKMKTRFSAYTYDIEDSKMFSQPDTDTNYRSKRYFLDKEENFETELSNGAIKKKRIGKKLKKYKLAVTYLQAPFLAFDVNKTENLLVGVAADEKIYVYNYKLGVRIKVLTGHNSEIRDVRFTKDGKYFATAGKDRSIIIWRTRDLRIEKRLYSNVFQKKTVNFSQDGNRIYVGDELGYMYAIDLSAVFPKISVTQPNFHSVNKIVRSPNGDGYYVATSNNYVYFKRNLSLKKPDRRYAYRDYQLTKSKKLILQKGFNVYQDPFGEVTQLKISPDGKKLLYTGVSDIPGVAYADIETGKVKRLYNYYSHRRWEQWQDIGWVSSNEFISLHDSSNILYHWDISHKRQVMVKTDTLPFVIDHFEPLDTPFVWINARGKGQFIYNYRNRTYIKQNDMQAEELFIYGNYTVIANLNHEIVFWDRVKKQEYARFKGHSEKITDINFHPTKDLFISSSDDGTVKMWRFKDKKLVVTLIPFRNEEFVFITEDNYYLITKGALKEIGFKKDGQFFYPDQFDLKYNRPDIVLREMGFANEDLLSAYNKAYQKRLKKLNFTEEQLSADFQLPEAEIVNINAIPAATETPSVDLHLKFKDSKYKLDRINIWVNDVAIKGKNGIDLRKDNVSEFEGNFKIDLANGWNKVEVSVLNQKGVESYKKGFEIESKGGKKIPNLYVVAMGVSKFTDTRFNLQYAAKDAKDICAAFALNTYFGQVKTKSVTDEEVVLSKLADIKFFVDQADIDDVVLVFVAGHGVLDNNFDYFFASHDMDFNNPAKNGIPYEEVEGLLDGIRALKKLLFLDTCHSGEVDKDDIEENTTPEPEGGDIQFRSAGLAVRYKDDKDGDGESDETFGLKSINELMKSVFADLRKGTGATVISSSGGAELSIESETYNNGLFTYCLINGLSNKLADFNKDKHIDLSELQRYIRDEVTRLSAGKQTPTSRITNDELNYRLW